MFLPQMALARYYSRLFAAYLTCHFAQRPATIIYPEEITADEIVRRFKTVLVVSQQVEMEPRMATLLRDAQTRGVQLFTDTSSRPELVKGL